MAYVAPYIDAAGLHIPTYSDIIDELVSQAQSIFGSDIYLDADSQDYQFMSIIALKIYDTMLAVQLAYNNRSPLTAIGAGLDAIVKINGLTRIPAAYSTCDVTISGTAGTVITNGVIQDTAGIKWNLPASVVVEEGGTVSATATCETEGPITALAGTLTKIMTPTAGWTSVTNAAAATPGQPIEADSALRARQAISVSLPSQTTLAGTIAAIAAIPGVTRSYVYENPTGAEDSNGIPAHSICAVVDGGDQTVIATAIRDNKGLGCGLFGSTTVAVEGEDISFSRPTDTPIYVTLDIHPIRNYTTDLEASIKQAVVDYLNSLQIGGNVLVSAIYGAAMSRLTSFANPEYSVNAVKLGTSESPTGTTNITIDYDHVASGLLTNVVINAV